MYLPKGWRPRPEQERLFGEITELFEDKRFVFLGAPTGIGKSAIARALLEEYKTGLVVTATKQLQAQYQRDFPEIPALMGRSNFPCDCVPGVPYNCEQGFYKRTATKAARKYCTDCPYKVHTAHTLASPFYVATYASALWTAADDAQRQVLIIDEGHRAEAELLSNVSVSISAFWMERTKTPEPENDNPDELFEWLKMFQTNLAGRTFFFTEEEQAESDRLSMSIKFLEMSNDELEWIPTYNVDYTGRCVSVEFKPLWLNRAISSRLLDKGAKVLFMSATILNPADLARGLSLRKDEWAYVESNEAFAPETRSVLYFTWSPPVTQQTYEDVKDLLVETIQSLLDSHQRDKGLIHTSSTKFATYLATKLEDSRLLLAHGKQRESAYKKHLSSPEPTVLVSPSMTEGVDLHDDLARFIIIAKAPFMSLGDRHTARRAEEDPDWYQMHTVRQIIQACGRGTRSANDSCVTYVLDAKVAELLQSRAHNVPEWFWEAWAEID